MDRQVRLEVAVKHELGSLRLDVAFSLEQPWTVLFGPSGVGKSTILRVIAGLLRPREARVAWSGPAADAVLADAVLADAVLTDTRRGVFVAPHRRHIRFVGQSAALFPHLTVTQNIAYAAGGSIEEVVRLCRVEHFSHKAPAALSGGERQRVALARALAAPSTRALLLDEPFSGLDVSLRDELLSELQPWMAERGIPVLQVTHDVAEIFALGADVVRIHDGKMLRHGPAEIVLSEERERLVTRLAANVSTFQG